MAQCLFRSTLIVRRLLHGSFARFLAGTHSHRLRPLFCGSIPHRSAHTLDDLPSLGMPDSIPITLGPINPLSSQDMKQQQEPQKQHQPQCVLFIYRGVQSDRFGFDLFLPSLTLPGGGSVKDTRLRLERSSDETVGKFLDRVSLGVGKNVVADGANRKKSNQGGPAVTLPVPHFSICRSSKSRGSNELYEIDLSQSLDSTFAGYFGAPADSMTVEPVFLRLRIADRDVLFRVVFNPARVLTCRLDLLPMVGCPVVPQLEAVNLSVEQSEFLWFATKTERWPSEPCHKGFIFYPKPEHLGCRLRVRVGARDSNAQPGVPFGNARHYDLFGDPVECKWPISTAPQPWFPENRMKVNSNDTLSNGFRVVSYNLLADMYASCETARNCIFRHCPEQCLDIKYRLPLILRELCLYQADFLCLQEVDQWAFKTYLQPALAYLQDMAGVYLGKRLLVDEPGVPSRKVVQMDQEKHEGCAIFYRKSKFELIRQAHLPSIMAYAVQRPHTRQLFTACETCEAEQQQQQPIPEYFEDEWRTHLEKCKCHCLLVAVFRLRRSEQPGSARDPPSVAQPDQFLVLANTHLYFHPAADKLRYVQASAVHDHLSAVLEETRAQSSLPVPVVLGGDINQSPNGPAYLALLGDGLRSCSDNEISQTGSGPLRMRSAYNLEPDQFTNWVPDFRAPLDVILYDTHSGLDCPQAYPLCTATEITRLAKEHSADQVQTRHCGGQQPVQESDLYALPNCVFPSDHLALVADFKWPADF